MGVTSDRGADSVITSRPPGAMRVSGCWASMLVAVAARLFDGEPSKVGGVQQLGVGGTGAIAKTSSTVPGPCASVASTVTGAVRRPCTMTPATRSSTRTNRDEDVEEAMERTVTAQRLDARLQA